MWKSNLSIRILLAFSTVVALLFPQLAIAADFFSSPDTDQSIYYLTELFGNVGTILMHSGEPETVLPGLFRIVNMSVLTFGVLVTTFSTIMSSVQSGQEGDPLTKKWGGAGLPLRVTAGMALLLPFRSGYCLAQIIMIYIVTQGVGAANQLWSVVLNNYVAGYSISVPVPLLQVDIASENLFRMATCAALAQKDPTLFTMSSSKYVDIYSYDQDTLHVGVPLDSQFSRVCGTIDMINLDDITSEAVTGSDIQDFYDLQKTAYISAFRRAEIAANEAIRSPRDQFIEKGVISRLRMELASSYDQLRLLEFLSPDIAQNDVAAAAQADGWMFAGAFYSKLVTRTSSIQSNLNRVPIPKQYDPNLDTTNNDNIVEQARTQYVQKANSYISQAEVDAVTVPSSKAAKKSVGSRSSMGEFDKIFGKMFTEVTDFFFKFMTQNSKQTSYSDGGVAVSDPLVSLGIAGNTILQIIEVMYITGLTLTVILMFAGCAGSGSSPACFGLGVIPKVIMPMITIMMTILMAGASVIGIYVPLVPYIQFLFGTLSWFILVIEAFAAAPLVALGLAAPGGEKFGKATHGIMLATNLFLRPPLMIIGFIFSARLLIAVFDFFNYSFSGTFASAVGNLGLFGICAVLSLYAGICTILVNEVFQVIHILPDKVIRWVGGAAEQTAGRALEMSQSSHQMMKSAAQMGSQAGVGAVKWLNKRLEGDEDDKKSTDAGEEGNTPKDKKELGDDDSPIPGIKTTPPPANGLATGPDDSGSNDSGPGGSGGGSGSSPGGNSGGGTGGGSPPPPT